MAFNAFERIVAMRYLRARRQEGKASLIAVLSLAVGVVGTGGGVGLAIVLASNIEAIRRWIEKVAGIDLFSPELYFLAELPARIQGTDVAWVAAMALGISLLATIYPSWRAASLDPVEALRYG